MKRLAKRVLMVSYLNGYASALFFGRPHPPFRADGAEAPLPIGEGRSSIVTLNEEVRSSVGREFISILRSLIVSTVCFCCVCGLPFGCVREPAAESEPAAQDLAHVRARVATSPALRATMRQTVLAYGRVSAIAEERQIIAVPFEARVRAIRVSPGQSVAGGSALVELEAGPEAVTQLLEARAAHEAAQKDFDQTKQRHVLKLATNQELLQGEQALRASGLRLESLERRGIAALHTVPAESASFVSKVVVHAGELVAAGSPLLELVAVNRIEIRLGVEPADVGALHVGQPVQVRSMTDDGGSDVEGTVRMVGRVVDPETHQVDVFVTIPGTDLLLNAPVRATITVAARQALVVPRAAALPDGAEYALFTVRDGKARRQQVRLGLQDGQRVEILGPGVESGDLVVIEGNYELADGMSLEVTGTP
jgi:membrane fusion protein, multidrug efflux system